MGGRHRTDELDDGYTSPREPSRRRRGGRGKVLVPLAGSVALAVLLGVAAFVIINRDRGCAEEGTGLRVTASPDIHPAVSQIAERFNKADRGDGGGCASVTVAKAASATVASGLSGSGGKVGAMDLWIPDSSLWVTGVRAKNPAVPEPAVSIAQSPVVMVASGSVVPNLKKSFGDASWAGMINATNAANVDGPGRKVRVLALDPALNSAGLGALLAAAGVATASGTGDEQLVGAMKTLSTSTVKDQNALLSSLGVKGRRVPLGVSSEQGVWAFNTTKKPEVPAVPLYPAEGTFNLDYPAVVTTGDADVRKAAEAFVKELGTPAAQKTLQDQGFRTPEGEGGKAISDADGFQAEAPQALPTPDPKTVASMSQSWSRINLGTRLVTLLDVSGTMALPIPGTGLTRMQAISRIAIEGMKPFPNSSEMGLWEFSTHLDGQGVDYRESVPVGPLTETVDGVLRRNLINQKLAGVRAKATGDTGLNDTLAAAYRMMKDGYKSDKINTILIMTDGAGNDDPDGGMSNQELLKLLQEEFDPEKPVSILIIAFGPDAPKGKRQMDAIAKATNGDAYIVKDILEIRKVFLEGMKRRLCSPHC
ncbi:substrate-binding and VWA domain-containing protein [Planomonospora sp. ID82291]|uniref:substrate-binding and VWA domain-containing protein n=1 Tax=Planomonospora sp. ID82291 TaxID=2738136 RepID=UPI0018C38FDA|nr:substrate-binding and VWA domain-containing protein [Planomonospora sp. ID82291]MBG0815629.1 VWA domain-containing protein [Planomonospora sp. ID82291]